jgi:hypothetical protein
MLVMALSDFISPQTIVSFPDLGIGSKIDQIIQPLRTIADFISYIIHPTKILWLFWHWTVGISYFICLFLCLGAVLLYIFGFKKYSKVAPISIALYVLIQAINSAVKL